MGVPETDRIEMSQKERDILKGDEWSAEGRKDAGGGG